MFDFLFKPYPAHVPRRSNLYIPISIGLFIGFFLLIFQPFGLHGLPDAYKEIKLLGYGLVTFVFVFLFFYGIPKLFPSVMDDRKWVVWKEIVLLNAMILCIAIGNTWYTNLINGDHPFSTANFLVMCFNTISVGVFPTIFMVFIDHRRLQGRYETESQNIHPTPKAPIHQAPFEIKIETDSTSITIDPDTFLYAESIGNYANIISHDVPKLKKELHRSTLKHLAENISAPNILRCHRSYIVNLDQVADVTGNAQGFKLTLKDCEEVIPVSRKYVPIVKTYFS